MTMRNKEDFASQMWNKFQSFLLSTCQLLPGFFVYSYNKYKTYHENYNIARQSISVALPKEGIETIPGSMPELYYYIK
jgi:hypothetical protein